MLDRDDRATAAWHLREHLEDVPADERDSVAALADALEAEPAGYDYEAAAAERGEALRGLLNHPVDIYPAWLYRDLERAREVMEGVERTHAIVPVAKLGLAARHARSAAKGGPPMWRDERNLLADAFEAAARGKRVEWPA